MLHRFHRDWRHRHQNKESPFRGGEADVLTADGQVISLHDLISANPKSVIDAKWIVYGDFLGDQKCSILRLIVAPGAKTTFRPECPTMFHTNGRSGRVGKLGVRYHQNMVLGEICPEVGFITQAALANGGVEIENTGKEPLVLTIDFPQNA